MTRGVLRALSLLTTVGIYMVVPILGAVYIGGRFFKRQPLLLVLVVLLGVAVAFRNLFKMMNTESKFKEQKNERRIGRPKGYEDKEE